jgi:transposase
MDILHPHCAGLDVHKETVVACARHCTPAGKVTQQTRTFPTHTAGLLSLLDWLRAEGVTHAARESTGVYWKPVFHLLEGHVDVLLVNAQHVKQVPGRKTDVKDAAWLAELLQHGLLRASFVPPRAHPRAARPDAAAHPAGRGQGGGGQPHPEGAGGRQHQAGLRGH